MFLNGVTDESAVKEEVRVDGEDDDDEEDEDEEVEEVKIEKVEEVEYVGVYTKDEGEVEEDV
jgi:hypothetical protein